MGNHLDIFPVNPSIIQHLARDGEYCYSSRMTKDEEQARDYFQKNFPLSLVEHAEATGVLGGALYFEKMNFIERFLLKKISGKTDSFEDIREERIRDFVRQFEG